MEFSQLIGWETFVEIKSSQLLMVNEISKLSDQVELAALLHHRCELQLSKKLKL